MAKPATKPLISEVLKNANKLGTKGDRVKYLQEQDCTALKDILRINFDETIHQVNHHLKSLMFLAKNYQNNLDLNILSLEILYKLQHQSLINLKEKQYLSIY